MADNVIRDRITIQDEQGNAQEFEVEALFDMNEESYALLKSKNDFILMRVVGEGDEQYLVGIEDQEEATSILDAYQIAVDAAADQ